MVRVSLVELWFVETKEVSDVLHQTSIIGISTNKTDYILKGEEKQLLITPQRAIARVGIKDSNAHWLPSHQRERA